MLPSVHPITSAISTFKHSCIQTSINSSYHSINPNVQLSHPFINPFNQHIYTSIHQSHPSSHTIPPSIQPFHPSSHSSFRSPIQFINPSIQAHIHPTIHPSFLFHPSSIHSLTQPTHPSILHQSIRHIHSFVHPLFHPSIQ